jgi:hypothetical protein
VRDYNDLVKVAALAAARAEDVVANGPSVVGNSTKHRWLLGCSRACDLPRVVLT